MPQAVEVTLGTSGETLTLITTEAGGFTSDGEAFATGTDAIAQANGRAYTLTLDGATQSAAYETPAAMSLGPGTSGGMITIKRFEDGSYQANGSAIGNGVVVTAENGNMYTVMISDDGMFSAEYVVPAALSIPLLNSGSVVEVTRLEDGSFSIMGGEGVTILGGDVLNENTRAIAANGNEYAPIFSPTGAPIGVMHVEAMQDVMLGMYGGTVTVKQIENMTWWIGDIEVKTDAENRIESNGRTYIVTADSEDMWSAMYQPVYRTVTLLTQGGSIMLKQAEDMSWWDEQGRPVPLDGSYETTSDNGNRYTLWYTDGEFTARFEPESMMIEGTGLVAMTREADDDYQVGDVILPANGMGDVTVGDAMYRVWMLEGALMGARYDAAIKDKAQAGPEDAGGRILTPADVALSKNDPDTVANEAGTMLVIAGAEYPVGALLGGGAVSKTGATFVDGARAEVEKLARQVTALADLNASLDREDRSDYSTVIKIKWGEAQKAVNSIFGSNGVTLPSLSERGGRVDEARAVEDFDALLSALASADMFEAALDDGILEDGASAALDNKVAAEVFGAVKSESSAMLGATETTRYGVFASQGRRNALDDLKFTVAGADTGEHQGAIGAFAYGLVDDTVRTSHLPSSGTASYEGGTTAVSGGRDPELYSGMFSMEVNFPTSRVTALITNLQDEQGNPWQYQLRDAESIYFPGVNLDGTAHFKARPGYQASVTHVGFAAQPFSVGDTQFEGWLLGAGRDNEAGTGAFGTWSLGDRDDAGSSYLVGSFGAERTGIREADRPSVGAAGSESWVTQGDSMGFFKQGGTVFRPLAGGTHPDDDDTVYEIDLATMEANAETNKKTLINGNRKVDELRRDIQAELAKLEGFIAVDEADGSSTSQYDGREAVWAAINDMVLNIVFAHADETTLIYANAKDRPNYDAELERRPSGSLATDPDVAASQYYVDGSGTYTTAAPNSVGSYDAGEEVTLSERAQLMVLSRTLYPGLTGDNAGTPNDDAARQEIQAVLAALANGTTLAAALGEGGLWEGLLGETRTTYLDENYDGYADVKSGKRRIDETKEGAAWGARTFKTHVQLGSTDYTRFGIAWGKVSTSSFAYSPLPQVRYASAAAPGYPGGASATYRGSTVVRGAGNTPYEGTVEVDVSWDADTINESQVTVTFSELAKMADSEPFSIGYILVDSTGARLLKNGNSATAGATTGAIDYHAYETANGGSYRGMPDTQQVVANQVVGSDGSPTDTADPAIDTLTTRAVQLSKDPRNGFADMEHFDVDEIVFRSNITVTNEGEMLAFATSSTFTTAGADGGTTTPRADIDIVWADRSFENTSLAAIATDGSVPTGIGGSIEGEFVGQGADGPLAAMGIWSFIAPTGVLEAATVGTTTSVTIGGSAVDVYDGWQTGTAMFAPSAGGRFDPNTLYSTAGAVINGISATDGTYITSVTAANGNATAWTVGLDGYVGTTLTPSGQAANPTTYGTEIFGAFGTGP